MAHKRIRRSAVATNWDPVAAWYAGWVGESGSEHHRRLAIPAVLELLAPASGEHILDIGAGPGVLAPFVADAGAHYTGVDSAPGCSRTRAGTTARTATSCRATRPA